MVDEVAKTALIYDASGMVTGIQLGMDANARFIASLNQVQATLAKTNESVSKVADTLRRVDTVAGETKFLAQIAKSFDPLSGAIQKAQRDLDRLNGIILKGGENAAQAQTYFDAVSKRLQTLQAAAGAERLNALTKAFDPAVASAKQMTAELAALNEAQRLGVNIAGGYQAAFDKIVLSYDEGYIAAKRLTDALIAQGRAESAQQVATDNQSAFNKVLGVGGTGKSAQDSAAVFMEQQAAIDKENAALVAQSSAFGGVSAEVIRLTKLVDQLNLAQTGLKNQMQAGAVSTSVGQAELARFSKTSLEASEAIKLLNSGQVTLVQATQRFPDLFQKGTTAFKELEESSKAATFAFGLNKRGFLELQAAGVNTFQALASGIGFWRVAMTEGAQVAGAFIQGINGFFTATLRLIPVVAPIAAVVGVIAAAVAETVQANTQLREFNVILSGMGTIALTSAESLRGVVKELRDTGTAADEALKAVQAIIRVQGINPSAGAVARISNLGRDIATVQGGDLVDWSKRLAEALAGGEVSAEKFAFSLAGPNGLTAAEAASAQAMARHGDTAGSLNIIVAALERQFGGQFKKNLSDTNDIVIALRKSWNDLIETLSKSDFIKTIVDQFKQFIDDIKNFIASIDTAIKQAQAVIDWLKAHAPSGEAANKQAQSNQQELADALRARGASEQEIQQVLQNRPPLSKTPSAMPAPAAWPFANLPTTNLESPASSVPGGIGGQNVLGLYGPVRGPQTFTFPTRANPTGAPQPSPDLIDETAKKLDEEFAALERVRKGNIDAEKAQQGFGLSGKAAVAWTTEYNASLAASKDANVAWARANEASRHVTAEGNIEIGKSAQLTDMLNQSQLKTADAYKQNAVAGLQAAAMAQAVNDQLTIGGNVQERYQQLLNTGAAAALVAARQQSAAAQISVEQNTKLAAAAETSAAAEHKQQIENAATAQTQDAVNKATAAYGAAVASNNPTQIAFTKTMLDAANAAQTEAIAQAQVLDKLKQRVEIAHQIRSDSQALDVAKLELSLVGQTSDEIEKQVDLLRTKQQLEEMGLTPLDEQYQARLRSREVLDDELQKLKQAQEAQSRWTDAIRNVGDSLSSGIAQTITDMLSGKKITDWANTFKSALLQIGQQLLEVALIKPALGSILSILGAAPSLVSSFGTLGSLFGGGGIGSSGQQISGTTSGGQSFTGTLSNVSSAVSAGNSISSIGSGGGIFSSNGLFGGINLGGALGFATPLSTTGSTAAAIAGLEGGGAATSALAEGSLFGTASLGSLAGILGPVAAVGGILATVLPSIIGKGSQNYASSSTLSGGQISLFGQNQANSKTSSQVLTQLQPIVQALTAAGFTVPEIGATYGSKTGLQTRVTGTPEQHYGSLAQANVDTFNRILSVLKESTPGFNTFADVLLNASKAASSAASDTSKSFSDLSSVFADAQKTFQSFYDTASSVSQPVDELEQRFAQIGQTIINAQFDRIDASIAAIGKDANASFSDAASAFAQLQQQYQTALQEASASYNTWDQATARFQQAGKALMSIEFDKITTSIQNLSKAAVNVPSIISNYIDAFNQLNAAWAALLQQATALGQLWDPVTTRIRAAAATLLDQATNSAWTTLHKEFTSLQPGQFAAELQKINDTFTALHVQANDIFGISSATLNNAWTLAKNDLVAWANQATKDAILQITDPRTYAIQQEQAAGAARLADIQAVGGNVNLVKQLNALSLQKVIDQFDNAGNAATNLADALKGLQDAISQLTMGPLSGLSPADAAKAAMDQFQATFAKARTGDVASIAALSQQGTSTVQAYQTAYGNAPQTAAIRAMILQALQQTLTAQGKAFASGTTNTPPGAILVGERGPEIIHQSGGLAVTPFDRVAPSIKEAIKNNSITQSQALISAGTPSSAGTPITINTTAAAHVIDRTHQKTMLILSSLLEKVSHHVGLSMPLLHQLYQINDEKKIDASQAFNTFQSTYRMARRGDPLSIAELPEKATSVRRAYNEVYGVAAPAAMQMNSIITKELTQTLAAGGRAFAGGTSSTPPGWILVGEKGPELIHQSGNHQVIPLVAANMNVKLPNPTAIGASSVGRPTAADGKQLIDELRNLRTDNKNMIGELVSLRRQLQGGQVQTHVDLAENTNEIRASRNDMKRPTARRAV